MLCEKISRKHFVQTFVNTHFTPFLANCVMMTHLGLQLANLATMSNTLGSIITTIYVL